MNWQKYFSIPIFPVPLFSTFIYFYNFFGENLLHFSLFFVILRCFFTNFLFFPRAFVFLQLFSIIPFYVNFFFYSLLNLLLLGVTGTSLSLMLPLLLVAFTAAITSVVAIVAVMATNNKKQKPKTENKITNTKTNYCGRPSPSLVHMCVCVCLVNTSNRTSTSKCNMVFR